jgi:GH35 family endo-1,4-beta-xylanase
MIDRRALLAAVPALAACDRFASAQDAPVSAPPLKSVSPAPFGTCIQAGHIDDPAWVALARANVSQLTPEWEMKMEYIAADGLDAPYRFDRTDRIVDFAQANGMAVHGHTLIWYSQGGDLVAGLSGAEFDRVFDDYVATVAGHYRGKVRSWDVVNEPITDDGEGMRDCHWSREYGADGYVLRAFQKAKAADPEAVLFLNDYNLENTPRKGAEFLRLVERLLKAGCPLEGIGTQAHLDIEIPPVSACRSMCRSWTRRCVAKAASTCARTASGWASRRGGCANWRPPSPTCRRSSASPSVSGACATPTAGCVRATRTTARTAPCPLPHRARPIRWRRRSRPDFRPDRRPCRL